MTAPTEKKPAVLPASEPTEERLREALAPFVRHYEQWMDEYPDSQPCGTYARVTFGQLRAARAALAKAPSHPPASAPEAGALREALEKIAAEWDGCIYYQAPAFPYMEIGSALRRSFAVVLATRATVSAGAERPSVMRADPAPEPLVYPAVQASGEKTLPSRRGSAE